MLMLAWALLPAARRAVSARRVDLAVQKDLSYGGTVIDMRRRLDGVTRTG